MTIKKIIATITAAVAALTMGIIVENVTPMGQAPAASTAIVPRPPLPGLPVPVNYFAMQGGIADNRNLSDYTAIQVTAPDTIKVRGEHLYSVTLVLRHQEHGLDIFSGALTDRYATQAAAVNKIPKGTVNVPGAYVDAGVSPHVTQIDKVNHVNEWEINIKNLNVPTDKDVVVTYHKADTGLVHDVNLTFHVVH
ncbi:MAG: hypothetical protein LBT80_06360 [Lactobacillaceae bacterium]|jgi:hypothetical protein|nr:hypothetical protein [Lactobacillaceae bacterium]